MGLKIDMYKAYDKVNWHFLGWLMDSMNFPAKCRHWIMQRVSIVSYSILINGEATKVFKPTCGIRQGDPLSPYLFILVMEAFSRIISGVEKKGRINGLQLSRRSPSIFHLFFADESLLFFKANPNRVGLSRT